jgi:hypothetical protein
MEGKWCTLIIILVSVGIILLAILLPLSFSVSQINEFNLVYNTWSKTLTYDPEMAESGRYFTGLTVNLLHFDRNKLLIQFKEGYDGAESGILKGGGNSLQAWTKEGANVYLEASYYFSIHKEKILDMYLEYGPQWLDFLVRMSFSVLKSTTVEFFMDDFITNSGTVATKMKQNLVEAFKTNMSESVVLDAFQLEKVTFDDSLNNGINSKLISEFRRKSLESLKNITITNKETERDVQIIKNNIQKIIATNGTALSLQYRFQERGLAIKNLVKEFCNGYMDMKTKLGLADVTELAKYMWVTELKLDTTTTNVAFLDKQNYQKTISGLP